MKGLRQRLPMGALLLVICGVSVGYWLTHQPGPVLRTTATGTGPSILAALDEWNGRLYLSDIGDHTLHGIETRTGTAIRPPAVFAHAGSAVVSHRHPLAFVSFPTGAALTIIDLHRLAILSTFPVPLAASQWFLDDATDTVYAVDQSGTISIIDASVGRLRPRVSGCAPGTANAVVSHATGHLFLSCGDGSTEMRDARTGRFLRSIDTASLQNCTCRRIVDERTGRVFVPGHNALGVLDARTGALLSTQPIPMWESEAAKVDARASGGIDMDPQTGNVVVAPYEPIGLGRPARAVLVLDGRTGATRHRWPVSDYPLAVLVNPITHHLLVASAGPIDAIGEPLGDGVLSILDMKQGATLQRVEVGILPGMLLADVTTKRLLVVNFTRDLDQVVLTRSYDAGWWPKMARKVKGLASWLPVTAPAAPAPPRRVTVTTLDLAKL